MMTKQRGKTRLLTFLLTAFTILGSAISAAQSPTTWWPDPASGLMWTGSGLYAPPKLDHQRAVDACAGLTIGEYKAWRLPSLDELHDVTETTTFYAAHNARNGLRVLDYSQPTPGSELLFNGFSDWGLWTSTVSEPGKFYVLEWAPPGHAVSVKANENGADIGWPIAYCVRAMEPELLALAKAAHPPAPVSSLPQLNSIALLVQAEDAIAANQFDQSIATARQAILLDPKSIRGYDDIGMANAYAGRFPAALDSLKTAQKFDRNLLVTLDDIAWVKALRKQAATDPHAVQGQVLVMNADIALQDKQYEQAIALANQIIALEPAWPHGYDRLGNALGGLDQWTQAITALQKAAALDKHKQTNAKADLANAKTILKKESKQS